MNALTSEEMRNCLEDIDETILSMKAKLSHRPELLKFDNKDLAIIFFLLDTYKDITAARTRYKPALQSQIFNTRMSICDFLISINYLRLTRPGELLSLAR